MFYLGELPKINVTELFFNEKGQWNEDFFRIINGVFLEVKSTDNVPFFRRFQKSWLTLKTPDDHAPKIASRPKSGYPPATNLMLSPTSKTTDNDDENMTVITVT